jgi:hypothetical protein
MLRGESASARKAESDFSRARSPRLSRGENERTRPYGRCGRLLPRKDDAVDGGNAQIAVISRQGSGRVSSLMRDAPRSGTIGASQARYNASDRRTPLS